MSIYVNGSDDDVFEVISLGLGDDFLVGFFFSLLLILVIDLNVRNWSEVINGC